MRQHRASAETRSRLSAALMGRQVSDTTRAAISAAHQARFTGPYFTVSDRGFTTPCWIWARALLVSGYGAIHRDHRSLRAHRWVFEQYRGRIPDGIALDHLCEQKACVNPDHLEMVTRGENSRRFRSLHPERFGTNPARGERSGTAKLTESDVLAIRAAVAAGESRRSVARRYNMEHGNIMFIVSRKTWKHI